MNLFGLYGMFLIGFGFLCIFLVFSAPSRLISIVHKDFFYFWVFLSFSKALTCFLRVYKKVFIYFSKFMLFGLFRFFSIHWRFVLIFWEFFMNFWGFMNLFRPYGMLLFSFGFLCIFFGLFGFFEIHFDRL